jgi:hypothetical protein
MPLKNLVSESKIACICQVGYIKRKKGEGLKVHPITKFIMREIDDQDP